MEHSLGNLEVTTDPCLLAPEIEMEVFGAPDSPFALDGQLPLSDLEAIHRQSQEVLDPREDLRPAFPKGKSSGEINHGPQEHHGPQDQLSAEEAAKVRVQPDPVYLNVSGTPGARDSGLTQLEKVEEGG